MVKETVLTYSKSFTQEELLTSFISDVSKLVITLFETIFDIMYNIEILKVVLCDLYEGTFQNVTIDYTLMQRFMFQIHCYLV